MAETGAIPRNAKMGLRLFFFVFITSWKASICCPFTCCFRARRFEELGSIIMDVAAVKMVGGGGFAVLVLDPVFCFFCRAF